MNYIPHLLIGLSLVLCSCNTTPIEANKQPEVTKSNIAFKLDYAQWQLTESKSLTDFQGLFDKTSSINLANIQLDDGSNNIYSFNQGLGEVVINKIDEQHYGFMEYYIIPIGNVYGKVALLRYIFDVNQGEIIRDKNFQPQLRVYKYWYNHIVKEYDSHLSDTSYTSSNWDVVPHAAFDVMRFLMFNLTLAAIDGCDECETRINRIATDYSFVKSAEYGQNLMVCRAILEKVKQ